MIERPSGIKIEKFSPTLGAIITGVDLSQKISDAQFDDINQAFLDYQVLFFKDQKEIPPELHIEFGKKFGELHSHPAAPTMEGYPEIFEIHAHKDSKIANGEFWHSDVSCDKEPPLGTMLQLHILPETGGDTMFSNMYAAYDELSNKYKEILLITGKGLHSTNDRDIYVSKNLGTLRYSVPEFIKSNKELNNIIISIKEADIKDGGEGALLIKLKNL